MADSKISALAAAAAVTADDLLALVDDPGGTPTSKKATVTQLATFLRSLSEELTNKTINGSSNTITNVSLSAGVTGTLPIANGGTGQTTFTAGLMQIVTSPSLATQSLALGTGVATWITTPSSANLAAAITDETGSGSLVFNTAPTFLTRVSMGPTPATSGEIRLSNNWFIWARDSGDGSNVKMLGLSSGDIIQLGAGGGFPIEIESGNLDPVTVKGQEILLYGNGIQIGDFSGDGVDIGGGIGVIGIDDANTVPSTDPTAGIIVYSEGGVLKYRDPSGDIIVLDGSGGGGTPGGSEDEVQVNDGAGGFAAASNVRAGSGFVSIGADPVAATGGIRFAAAALIASRNTGDSADFELVKADGSFVYLGDFARNDSGLNVSSGGAISLRATGEIVMGVTQRGVWTSAGLHIGPSSPSFGGGTGVLGIEDAVTPPGSNPTGGVVIYSESGAAKVRGSGGTVTTFGPADLDGFKATSGDGHCPACGTDFAMEWSNAKYGSLTICLRCLAEELGDRPWIVRRSA